MLYLSLHSAKNSQDVAPLLKPLEDMTNEEIQDLASKLDYNVNSQLFVALRDYVLEQP